MDLSPFMSSEGDIVFIGPMCSWEMPECSASAVVVLAGFLNSVSMEDNLNGRRPQCEMTSISDDLNGRKPNWKTTSREDYPNGRQPQFILMSNMTIF